MCRFQSGESARHASFTIHQPQQFGALGALVTNSGSSNSGPRGDDLQHDYPFVHAEPPRQHVDPSTNNNYEQ